MSPTKKFNIQTPLMGLILSLFVLSGQRSLATERWKMVVLPDVNYHHPSALSQGQDLHSVITQGLTTALSSADFDVINQHYMGLPNCSIEDCSNLTNQHIKQVALESGKNVNLVLLYQLSAFKHRQAAVQKWYFNLSGRLLDLQSGTQQDAFTVDDWVNSPSRNCIGDCLNKWARQHLTFLTQDLGKVLSEKLAAIPRRFHYQLKLQGFSRTHIQQIDRYLKSIQGYVADRLLDDGQNTSDQQQLNKDRSYHYTSELTASELGSEFANYNLQQPMAVEFDYDSEQRQFTLYPSAQDSLWSTINQFFASLITEPQNEISLKAPLDTSGADLVEPETPASQTDEEKENQREQQMWQQAQTVDSLDSYQQYLTLWPQGQYLIPAEAAIKAILDDKQAWQQALIQNTRQSFQQYLSDNPKGQFSQQAKQQLLNLLKQQQLIQKQQENKLLADEYYQQENYSEALYYYLQGAKLDEIESSYLLANMYQQGLGTEPNMPQAVIWYKNAAQLGHIQAQVTLGYMYSKGKGVEQDLVQAIKWYKAAAKQGQVIAQYNLAYQYSLGQNLPRDYQQAAYWYQQAANQGDADAQASLGKLYEKGLGVEQDLSKAKNLYQRSAAQGNHIAKLHLQMLKNATP